MGKRDALAKTLAIIGTSLIALPLLAPLALGLVSIGHSGGFRFDYLMPFEIYPVTLIGMALLLGASFRAQERRGAVGISIAGMIVGLVLASVAAQVTGIANSVEQLETWKYILTAGLAVVSVLSQIVLFVVGCLLVRYLVAASGDSTPSPRRARGDYPPRSCPPS